MYIITCIDDTGTSFLIVSGRGTLGKKRAHEVLNGRVGKGALVVTGRAGAFPAVFERLGAKLEQKYTKTYAINRINSLRARLKDFMRGFKGISTKHFQSYLPWFKWIEAFKSCVTERCDAIGRQLQNGVYRITRRMYLGRPMISLDRMTHDGLRCSYRSVGGAL